MNGDLQAAGKLLTELREAYRSLPRLFQADVAHVLSALAQEQAAQMVSRKEAGLEEAARPKLMILTL